MIKNFIRKCLVAYTEAKCMKSFIISPDDEFVPIDENSSDFDEMTDVIYSWLSCIVKTFIGSFLVAGVILSAIAIVSSIINFA